MQIKHSGLRALHESGDGSRLSADLVPRLRRILLRVKERPGLATWRFPATTCTR